jgi:hypothetical protein
MQTQGDYAFKPFACLDAAWHPPSQSYSCSIESEIGDFQVRETVTVGSLPNNFCANLRDQHNPVSDPHEDNPILHQSECGSGGNCSCYEVRHECRLDADDVYDEGACPPDFAQISSGGASAKGGDDANTGRTPPSRGAGSGG